MSTFTLFERSFITLAMLKMYYNFKAYWIFFVLDFKADRIFTIK